MNFTFGGILFVLLIESQVGLCKNILAIFPHFGKSHYFMYEPYIQKLEERGHNVTVITWFKNHNLKNVEVISIGDDVPLPGMNLKEYEAASKLFGPFTELQLLKQWGQEVCTKGLSDPRIKDLIKSKRRFDLVIVEYFNTDCYAVFAHFFNAPLIGIFSSAPMPWLNDRMGNPDNPSYIVSMFSGYRSHMSFFERVKNTLSLFSIKMYYKYFFSSPTDRIIKRHLGKGIPKVDDMVRNTSLLLVNSHFSLFQPRPCVPAFVEVGGMHVQAPQKLPSDLQKYLDNSKNGVIYFSLGTVTNGSTLPPKKRDALLRTFAAVDMDVLWKWEADDMPGKPKNVLIKKWIPQRDILDLTNKRSADITNLSMITAHPKVKLFISHGGLMGTTEAVLSGVPMILIPLFGDQFLNAESVAEKGAGIVFDYFSISEQRFSRALKAVLEDRSFAENAKLLAAKFAERPLTPMNAAIYWTEYILKFKGAPHMRSAVMKLSWFSEYLIDVIIFCALVLYVVIFVAKKVVLKIIETRRAQEEAKKKKN